MVVYVECFIKIRSELYITCRTKWKSLLNKSLLSNAVGLILLINQTYAEVVFRVGLQIDVKTEQLRYIALRACVNPSACVIKL